MTAIVHQSPDKGVYTVYTNVRFLKPVIIGQDGTITVLLRCQISCRRTVGRKIIILASIEGHDGSLYATAESMLIERAARKRRDAKI